jgi:hypothetical protein
VRRIGEETGDGDELVDYMLRVFRDEGSRPGPGWRPPPGSQTAASAARSRLVGEAQPAIMPSEISKEELAAELRRRLTLLEGARRAAGVLAT